MQLDRRHFVVMGKNGASLEERYKPYPETYLSMAVDGFPNYFMMLGPNAGVGSGSLTILEMEDDYITKCIRKLQKEDYVAMTPKRERVRDFSQYIDEYFKKTGRLLLLVRLCS
jgi:cation diffusion facilitator CzcD-associated flavoprotein CzcO